MQYILKGILDIRDRLIKDRESTSAEDEKRGNVPLFAVLETYEEFRRGLEEFRTEREALTQAGVKRSGRPSKHSLQTEYVKSLVVKLYALKNEKIRADNLGDTVSRAEKGTADILDPDKSKHWIDIFSALNLFLGLFSPDGDKSFYTFHEKYLRLYSRLNNKKTVIFYPRFIKELAAMYTVYRCETYATYNKIQEILRDAWLKGLAAEPREDYDDDWCFRSETKVVNYGIMTLLGSDKSDEDTPEGSYDPNNDFMLYELKSTIFMHPHDFVYEEKEQDKRHRRYYCIIRDLIFGLEETRKLATILTDGALVDELRFVPDELLPIFKGENVDYAVKDEHIRLLEAALVGRLAELSGEDRESFLDLIVMPRREFLQKGSMDYNYAYFLQTLRLVPAPAPTFDDEFSEGEIVIYESYDFADSTVKNGLKLPDCVYIRRSTEAVADGVVRLLRFITMLSVIYLCEQTENTSYITVRRNIDCRMAKLELSVLPESPDPEGTAGMRLADVCVDEYIKEYYK